MNARVSLLEGGSSAMASRVVASPSSSLSATTGRTKRQHTHEHVCSILTNMMRVNYPRLIDGATIHGTWPWVVILLT